jgi:hypothetical protein
MIKRDRDKVWLDLDDFYPPPKQHPNTVFKSMAIAFQACGAKTTYVELMGISAAAFRIQVGGYLCPSSPHPHLGFSCAALAQEALGHDLLEHEWDACDTAKVKEAKEAVVQSVESGRPALTEEEETGLAMGYVGGGEHLLVRDPYSNKGDEPAVLEGDWPGWGMTTIGNLPSAPTREGVTKSLETAVMLARTDELLGNSYTSGFAAYDHWTAALRDPTLVQSADVDAGALVLGNAHIYYCLVDARRCAAEYLQQVVVQFLPDIDGRLTRAAELYGEIAQKLDTGWENVPWPSQLSDPSEAAPDTGVGGPSSQGGEDAKACHDTRGGCSVPGSRV